MYYYCHEHPDIAAALRSGDSRSVGKSAARCFECGAPFSVDDTAFIWEVVNNNRVADEVICELCFDEHISSLNRMELAALVGSRLIHIHQYLNGDN